jgi:hypothetical protein
VLRKRNDDASEEACNDGEQSQLLARRSVLRFGGIAAAGAAAAVATSAVDASPAEAAAIDQSTTPYPTITESHAALTVPPRALSRWRARTSPEMMLTTELPAGAAVTKLTFDRPVTLRAGTTVLVTGLKSTAPTTACFQLSADVVAGTTAAVTAFTPGNTYPVGSHVSAMPFDDIIQLVLIGDSTTAASNSVSIDPSERRPAYTRPFFGWAQRLAVMLSGGLDGGLLSYGFRGVWIDWTFSHNGRFDPVGSASFPPVGPGSLSDVVPWGQGRLATATNPGGVATWTKPAWMTRPLTGGYLYWIDDPAVGQFSYRVNGGAWSAMPSARLRDHKLKRFWIGGNIRVLSVRNATTNSAATGCGLAGFEPWTAPRGTTNGFILHNLAMPGQYSGDFIYASSGDPLAFLDSVVDETGDVLCNADLFGVMFVNDTQPRSTDYSATKARYNAIVDRMRAYADGFILAYVEQGGSRLNGPLGTAATQSALRDAGRTVSANRGLAFINLYDALAAEGVTGFAQAAAAGFLSDSVHPSQLLHDDIAARVFRMLTTY